MEWLTKEWDSQFMDYNTSQCIWVSRKFITPELIINQRKDIILLLTNPTRSIYLPITKMTSIRYRGWTQLKWPSHKVWVQLIQWELSVDKSKVLKWNLGCGHGWNKKGKIIETFSWIFPWNMSYIFHGNQGKILPQHMSIFPWFFEAEVLDAIGSSIPNDLDNH